MGLVLFIWPHHSPPFVQKRLAKEAKEKERLQKLIEKVGVGVLFRHKCPYHPTLPEWQAQSRGAGLGRKTSSLTEASLTRFCSCVVAPLQCTADRTTQPVPSPGPAWHAFVGVGCRRVRGRRRWRSLRRRRVAEAEAVAAWPEATCSTG